MMKKIKLVKKQSFFYNYLINNHIVLICITHKIEKIQKK